MLATHARRELKTMCATHALAMPEVMRTSMTLHTTACNESMSRPNKGEAMAWHEDQPIVDEGFNTLPMVNTIQVGLPITFSTKTLHPIAEDKLYVQLTNEQRDALPDSGEAIVNASHQLTAENGDLLKGMFDELADFNVGFFSATIGAGMKFVLPANWVTSAIALAVKTLVGSLLSQPNLKETASYRGANLAGGGQLRELWHTVTIEPGKTYFYRTI
ncbi:hypothetical protein [Paraburkholderia sp. SIMBA_030]|uniref:hypothetical protein n=1 Tax=Paraburkholderia sp. SIMBA_030 TaxID=3085773 RepID=UPI00397934D4